MLYFNNIGHHIDAAAEGAEALRLLEAGTYAVILSDYAKGILSDELVARVSELAPGDPMLLAAEGAHALTNDQLALERAKRGLDAPLPVQYARWVGRQR